MHIIGELIAFGGASLLISGYTYYAKPRSNLGLSPSLFMRADMVKLFYFSRRFGTIPTAAVMVFCLSTAAFSLRFHLVLELPFDHKKTQRLAWAFGPGARWVGFPPHVT